MNVQLIMAGVVMDARIFKDATSAPALSDLSWIERKRTAKVFSFSLHKYTGQPKIPKECSVFNLKSMLFTCFTARDLKALLALSQHSAWLYRVIKPKKTFSFLFIIVMVLLIFHRFK